MQNADSNVICANCGAALNQNQQPPQQPPQAPEGFQQQPNPAFQQQPNPGFQQQPNFQQQNPYQQPPFQQQPPINGTPYLVWSIIVTVLCCWPLGIPAIVYAAKINKLVTMGDFFGAQEAAKKAKMFTIIAASLGFVVLLLYIVLLTSGAMAGIFPSLNSTSY
jgi:hypothetical protein